VFINLNARGVDIGKIEYDEHAFDFVFSSRIREIVDDIATAWMR